jgi:hypothetical protein
MEMETASSRPINHAVTFQAGVFYFNNFKPSLAINESCPGLHCNHPSCITFSKPRHDLLMEQTDYPTIAIHGDQVMGTVSNQTFHCFRVHEKLQFLIHEAKDVLIEGKRR